MRSFGFRLTLLVATLCTGIGSTASALGHHGGAVETVYVMPSSVSMPIATSYVVSTGWVEPTAYAVPTYYTTAYWMDPVVLAQPTYATTAYVRRGLLGRRWLVERPVLASYATTYAPTAYYAAPSYRATSYAVVDRTVVPTRYVASTDCVCPQVVAMAAPADRPYARSASPGTAAPRNGSSARNVESEPENLSTINSDVGPAPADTQAGGATGAAGETSARQTIPGTMPPEVTGGVKDTSPPAPPPKPQPPGTRPDASSAGGQTGAPAANSQGSQQPVKPAPGTNAGGNTGATPNTGAGGNTGATPAAPVAPAGSEPIIPPDISPSGEVRRNSMRPPFVSSAVRPEYRNILFGTVLNGAAREPEEGVQISVRNANGGRQKATTTNALGRFAVRLTDGDWAVDVTMPSGNVYEVSQIRVSNGVITDSQGRRVPMLEITR